MKVAIITPYHYPIKGGITTYVSGLHKSLISNGIESKIITRHGKGKDNVFSTNGKSLIYNRAITRLLNDYKPDVVHAHAHWYTLAPALSYRKKNPKAKVVFTFHTELTVKMNPIKRRIFERMLSKCNYVTFISSYLKGQVESQTKVKTNIAITYPGVETISIVKTDAESFIKVHKLENSHPILSFIGPLEYPLKAEGVIRLLRAFKTVVTKHEKSKLLVIGDGSQRPRIKAEISRLGLNDNVVIINRLDNIYPALGATDIYTHISLQESFGIAIIEAMSMGKAVVASKVGGIPEILEDGVNGILVKPEPDKIASAILELVADPPKMARLGDSARKAEELKFNWKNLINDYLKIYRGDGLNG